MGGIKPPAKQPPTVMSNAGFPGYRTISQHLNDLKKENFSLKLRIYFLEERIQQKYEESSGDVFKRVSLTLGVHVCNVCTQYTVCVRMCVCVCLRVCGG